MLTLANELRSFSIDNKLVYATEPRADAFAPCVLHPDGIGFGAVATRLLQPAIDQIHVQAQAMIDDPTEVPQLRGAAPCSLYAANHPNRWP